jgi:S-adenosylmethionine:tRNA ribosyltransferase-isomerase
VQTSEFDYSLPPELIAQTPIPNRDQSRLMVLNRSERTIEHHYFYEIVDYLREGDVLVLNDRFYCYADWNPMSGKHWSGQQSESG